MAINSEKNWHQLSENQVIHELASDLAQGLDDEEVQRRRQQFGSNSLSMKRGQSAWLRFLLQFHQPLIYILIAAGCITAALQEWVDAGVIFGVVLINAVIGYVQESKAENALAALATTMVAEATVLRQGEKQRIAATELVPGDIVLLQSGDRVPADLRLLRLRELQVDESALTGESLPVEKELAQLNSDTLLADRTNMVYASAMVTHGHGTAIVSATGDQTEIGHISQMMASAQDLATPLTRKIAHFSQLLLYVILALAGITVAIGLLRGQALFDMFMAAVALAVGAIPEGLPAAVTVTLAIGVARMARRRAIIRKLTAVETLGSTTVICSDKTGTLTKNQMTVQAIMAGGHLFQISGGGYQPDGRIIRSDIDDTTITPALHECLKAGMLCNDSLLQEKDGAWAVQGDPTEGALLAAAGKGGLQNKSTQITLPRVDTIPFESRHQYMATLHDPGAGKPNLVYAKGAVEQILAKCTQAISADGSISPLQKNEVLQMVADMAGQGLRVLAFGRKEMAEDVQGINHEDLDTDFIFLGLQGMIDPPRDTVRASVKTCRQAGIKVKMITGDHPHTAGAIAGQIGLRDAALERDHRPSVLTGRDLEKLSDAELMTAAEDTIVFARATPEQKIRLVRALQAKGHVVAMTGDGVNDAPALKQADIGVAMGITGTDVSKEAADMVLTDDNFSSIEAAVEEGRGVFDNLTKFIVWTLPTNLGEGLVILAAIIFNMTLPILPVQILWINMTTAGFLGLTLAFETKEADIMQRMPRNPQTPILTGELITRIVLVGTLLLIGAFGLFEWERAMGASLEQARTVAVNTFIVMELFYLFNCRSMRKSIFQLGVFTNMWVFGGIALMVLIQLGYTYLPFMQRLFQSAALDIHSWIRIVSAGLALFIVVELEKKVRRR